MSIPIYDQVIIEQNRHWDGDPYQHAFSRFHQLEAEKDLDLEEMMIITGIRRSGKSTLMQMLMNHLMQAHKPKSIFYINFDDPNYQGLRSHPAEMYDVITAAEKLSNTKIHYLFLDEVQNVQGWEQYAKSMYDAKRFNKIIITGSNAELLNSDYANLLTGRYIEIRLYPLCYQELLFNHGIKNKPQLIKQKSLTLKLFDDMMQFGGFPRIHQIKDIHQRRKLLKSYYETILLKDCVTNHQIRDTTTLMNLSHYLLTNSTTRYSYNSLSKAVESNENTIQKFIQIFEDAYFLQELKQFSFSLKKQLRMEKKIYCIDNGLIIANGFLFFDNVGKLLENLVYSELKKLSIGDIFFYNDGNECDFIINKMSNQQAIQVCYALTHESQNREIQGIKKIMKKFSINEGIIITYDQEQKIDDHIYAIPFWKYFYHS